MLTVLASESESKLQGQPGTLSTEKAEVDSEKRRSQGWPIRSKERSSIMDPKAKEMGDRKLSSNMATSSVDDKTGRNMTMWIGYDGPGKDEKGVQDGPLAAKSSREKGKMQNSSHVSQIAAPKRSDSLVRAYHDFVSQMAPPMPKPRAPIPGAPPDIPLPAAPGRLRERRYR